MKYYPTKREIILELVVFLDYLCTYPDFYGEKELGLDLEIHSLTSYMASW